MQVRGHGVELKRTGPLGFAGRQGSSAVSQNDWISMMDAFEAYLNQLVEQHKSAAYAARSLLGEAAQRVERDSDEDGENPHDAEEQDDEHGACR